MQRLLMQAAAAISVLAGLAAVGAVVYSVVSFAWATVLGSFFLVGLSIGAGFAASHFGREVDPVVFNNAAEREVLNRKQRQSLRKARGDVVMEKAMIEIEHERANVVHNLELDAADPNKPPFQTQFSPETDWTKRLPAPAPPRPLRCEHNRKKGECFEQDCAFY